MKAVSNRLSLFNETTVEKTKIKKQITWKALGLVELADCTLSDSQGKKTVSNNKSERDGNKKRNSFEPDCPHFSLEGIVQQTTASFSVSSDPQTFHQAGDDDVSYKYTREKILYWENDQ